MARLNELDNVHANIVQLINSNKNISASFEALQVIILLFWPDGEHKCIFKIYLISNQWWKTIRRLRQNSAICRQL